MTSIFAFVTDSSMVMECSGTFTLLVLEGGTGGDLENTFLNMFTTPFFIAASFTASKIDMGMIVVISGFSKSSVSLKILSNIAKISLGTGGLCSNNLSYSAEHLDIISFP